MNGIGIRNLFKWDSFLYFSLEKCVFALERILAILEIIHILELVKNI